MNHRYNSVKPFNGQLAFRREFRGICYLEDLFSHLMHLLQLCLYTSIYLTFRHKSFGKSENVVSIPLVACCVYSCLHVDIKWWCAPAAGEVVDSLRHSNAEYCGTSRELGYNGSAQYRPQVSFQNEF